MSPHAIADLKRRLVWSDPEIVTGANFLAEAGRVAVFIHVVRFNTYSSPQVVALRLGRRVHSLCSIYLTRAQPLKKRVGIKLSFLLCTMRFVREGVLETSIKE